MLKTQNINISILQNEVIIIIHLSSFEFKNQNFIGEFEYFVHVGWLCFASHRHQGHLETVPQFTVP